MQTGEEILSHVYGLRKVFGTDINGFFSHIAECLLRFFPLEDLGERISLDGKLRNDTMEEGV